MNIFCLRGTKRAEAAPAARGEERKDKKTAVDKKIISPFTHFFSQLAKPLFFSSLLIFPSPFAP